MKVFSVSKACNACGECVTRTSLLIEDSGGFAVPAPGKYIEESWLSGAENIAALCPMNALSIVEHSSVVSKGKAGLEELIKSLEHQLMAVEIPVAEDCDIAYHEKDYSVDYGYISDEGRWLYPSEGKAEQAGRAQFTNMFWNRRADFVTSILAQYKSKVLRKYFDLNEPNRTIYAEISKKMGAILNQIAAEAHFLSDGKISLPANFAVFHPELDDLSFKKYIKEKYDNWIVSSTYVKNFCESFGRMEYYRKSDYEGHIIAESHENTECDKKGRLKTTFIYSFDGANGEGSDLVRDILFYVGCAESLGLRSVDDISRDSLESVLIQYKHLVNNEISKKVTELENAVSKC